MRLKTLLIILGIAVLFATILTIDSCVQKEKKPLYVASVNSTVFHYPNCQWVERINPENRVYYYNVEQVIQSKRRPCRVCNPTL